MPKHPSDKALLSALSQEGAKMLGWVVQSGTREPFPVIGCFDIDGLTCDPEWSEQFVVLGPRGAETVSASGCWWAPLQ